MGGLPAAGEYEEIEKHNERLIKELEKAERDKEDLKTTDNNYFLQFQTLINQKAIEAPEEKKKPFWCFGNPLLFNRLKPSPITILTLFCS